MSDINLCFENIYEVQTLHKAVIISKFGEESDVILTGSAHLARIANDLMAILLESDYETWDKWRHIDESRCQWRIIVERVQNSRKWSGWSIDERNIYIDYLVAPFVLSQSLRTKLLDL